MRYRIVVQPAAGRALKRLPVQMARQLATAIEKLAVQPRPHGSIKMKGEPTYRIRIGTHRIVYTICDKTITVTIVKIGHRKDIYR